jgi:hypothetical protein
VFLVVLILSGCATRPGYLEVGAFRVGIKDAREDLENTLVALYKLKNPSATLVIYDASGSMRWPLAEGEHRPRFQPGQQGITAYLKQAKAQDHFGLIVFGHRLASGPEGSEQRQASCKDVEVVMPLQRLDQTALINTITGLELKDHKGDTPLETAIRVGVERLQNTPGEKKIILITDGNDECGGQPERAAREAAHADIRLYPIAFGVGIDRHGKRDQSKYEEVRRSLIDSANATKGAFFEAEDAERLYTALLQVELAVFTYTVRDQAGKEIVRGSIGQTVALNPGRYQVVFHTDTPFVDPITIQADKKTKLFIALSDAGQPVIRKVFE